MAAAKVHKKNLPSWYYYLSEAELHLLTNYKNKMDIKLSAAPSQQPPPQAQAISPTALRLYWGPPDNPNGVITKYTLFRNGAAIATVLPTGKFFISQLVWLMKL